jgi:hypothetical protein
MKKPSWFEAFSFVNMFFGIIYAGVGGFLILLQVAANGPATLLPALGTEGGMIACAGLIASAAFFVAHVLAKKRMPQWIPAAQAQWLAVLVQCWFLCSLVRDLLLYQKEDYVLFLIPLQFGCLLCILIFAVLLERMARITRNERNAFSFGRN